MKRKNIITAILMGALLAFPALGDDLFDSALATTDKADHGPAEEKSFTQLFMPDNIDGQGMSDESAKSGIILPIVFGLFFGAALLGVILYLRKRKMEQ